MTPLLSCRQLGKSYGARPLFQDLTLGVGPGERLGLIGPNGSGKSTLLRLLAGEETPDSGEISRRRSLRLVYLPQEDLFPPGQTVGDVMAETRRATTREAYERAAQTSIVLAQVGTTETDLPVETLSCGWKKRLALARALIQQPDLLLMD